VIFVPGAGEQNIEPHFTAAMIDKGKTNWIQHGFEWFDFMHIRIYIGIRVVAGED